MDTNLTKKSISFSTSLSILVAIIFLIVFSVFPFRILFADEIVAQENISITAQVLGESPDVDQNGNTDHTGNMIKLPNTVVDFRGIAYPLATVTVFESGKEKISTIADNLGNFSVTFDEKNEGVILYTLVARGQNSLVTSSLNFSIVIRKGYLTHVSGIHFPSMVPSVNFPNTGEDANLKGDCDSDHRLGMLDFLMMVFWYQKPSPPNCIDILPDNIVDFRDFSLLAYYWTG